MDLTTPPLAPKVVSTLATFNIRTIEDLQEINPCHAFLLLKKSGLSITQSVFWQLVGLCCQQIPDDLDVLEREKWLLQLQNTPPVAIFPSQDTMQYYMKLALEQAKIAANYNEIPVGAVVVYRGQVIASAYNRCVQDCSISHHAEILALAMAGKVLGNYRLNECDIYVSLEPCAMCASAILQARVARVIFAAPEPKTGAAGSVINLFADKRLNAHTAVCGGVLADESQVMLQQFFRQRRNFRAA